jgi:hypothetical protein
MQSRSLLSPKLIYQSVVIPPCIDVNIWRWILPHRRWAYAMLHFSIAVCGLDLQKAILFLIICDEFYQSDYIASIVAMTLLFHCYSDTMLFGAFGNWNRNCNPWYCLSIHFCTDWRVCPICFTNARLASKWFALPSVTALRSARCPVLQLLPWALRKPSSKWSDCW